MNTLIELYDERAIENILAPDMFHPRRIIYLCPREVLRDHTRQQKLAAFYRKRGWEPELIFVGTSLFGRTASCASCSPSKKNTRTAP